MKENLGWKRKFRSKAFAFLKSFMICWPQVLDFCIIWSFVLLDAQQFWIFSGFCLKNIFLRHLEFWKKCIAAKRSWIKKKKLLKVLLRFFRFVLIKNRLTNLFFKDSIQTNREFWRKRIVSKFLKGHPGQKLFEG